MKKYPNVTLKVLLKYRDRILIMRHKNGSYDFPGGQIEFGESLFGALQRELKEELNFKLDREPALFEVWNYISKDKKRHSVMVNYIYFLNKKPKLKSPEKLEILWLNKKEMKNIIKDHNFVEEMYSWRG